MMAAIVIATLLALPLLAIVNFVQVLYLESMRLRTRDLPAIKFFKETLEDKLGMKTEQGASSFSLVKHTLLVFIAICYFAWFADGEPWQWSVFWQAGLAAWLTMMILAYALPQLLYRRTKGEWLLPFVPLLRGMALVVRPFEALLSFFESLIELGDSASAAEEEPTPAENIEALISAGTEEGLIEEEDRKLIQSVVEFGDKVVREVMTPRPNIVAIQADSTLEQLRQIVITEQYSRIPAYEQSIDQIVGFVHVRDMFEVEEEERDRRTVRELLRPILFVPETKPVSDLMRQMQQENTHMVIVVDEYGNTAGLATMEDLLEVIIGEIRDEHEPDSDVTEDGQGGYIVSGNFDLARIGDLFESFHREEDIESTTVGGLVTEWLGRVPQPGEFVDRDGIRVEVLASDELRVGQVRISKSQAVGA
ncbi:MAG TPA: hemolysin family protein [Bryobacteraceae bacterium]|jgi:CBS domain containing-hemolysin-like protein|nr:hemolysin family protein [Bryobacteraceae bacterium]